MPRFPSTRGWHHPRSSCVLEADLPPGRAGLLAPGLSREPAQATRRTHSHWRTCGAPSASGVGSQVSPESEGSDAHTVPSATVVSAAREDMGPLEASLRVPPTGLCAEGHNLSPQLTIFISPCFSSFLMKTLTIKLGFPLEQKLAFPRRFTVQSEPLAACQSETLSPHTHDRDVLPDPASQSRSAEEASAWVVGAEVPRFPCVSVRSSKPTIQARRGLRDGHSTGRMGSGVPRCRQGRLISLP